MNSTERLDFLSITEPYCQFSALRSPVAGHICHNASLRLLPLQLSSKRRNRCLRSFKQYFCEKEYNIANVMLVNSTKIDQIGNQWNSIIWSSVYVCGTNRAVRLKLSLSFAIARKCRKWFPQMLTFWATKWIRHSSQIPSVCIKIVQSSANNPAVSNDK